MTTAGESEVVEKIKIWEQNKSVGLTAEDKVQLFRQALVAVERGTLRTLSHVTLEVVLDRALLLCKESFPVLSAVKIGVKGLNFDELMRDEQYKNSSEDLVPALRLLLVEILTVLGNITGGILSKPLYAELIDLNFEPTPNSETQNITRIHATRRNSENS